MNIERLKKSYSEKFNIIVWVDLDHWFSLPQGLKSTWIRDTLESIHCQEYQHNDRICFTLTQGEEYNSDDEVYGNIFRILARSLYDVDISNYFVVILTNDRLNHANNQINFQSHSPDPVPVTWDFFDDPPVPLARHISGQPPPLEYEYGSAIPLRVRLSDLSEQEKFLLTESRVFCMYPWIHIHAWPTGQSTPCCHAETVGQLGDCRQHSLTKIWNDPPMKKLRKDMLSEIPNSTCTRCYEQEKSGFFSGRQSANKHHGHNIKRIGETTKDGHLERFELTYWDIRFSNLCNLRCRSCGHSFSSSWYQDQARLAGPEWKDNNTVLNYAGRTETDMWEQLLPHIDHVEQIYFAGGEPLMMEEHYLILEELERREKFDVRLIYNTNFTHVKLKDRYVFDYWKRFKSVAVGASLDAMGPRAEYIRKGTEWANIESNRQRMLETCPEVDFYISPTLSIMNAWHLPDFHKDWTRRGLIKARDLNVNILQDPPHYRIDIAPLEFKKKLRMRFEEHLEWLRPLDDLRRATVGYESAIKYMMATDNSDLVNSFWQKTHQLDLIRNEKVLDALPELSALL